MGKVAILVTTNAATGHAWFDVNDVRSNSKCRNALLIGDSMAAKRTESPVSGVSLAPQNGSNTCRLTRSRPFIALILKPLMK